MRKYREKIRADPERHALYKQREKERYENKKARGIIRLKTDMSERELRICRREWRKRQKKVRLRRKHVCLSPERPTQPSFSSTEGIKRRRRNYQKTYRHIIFLFCLNLIYYF